MKTTAAFLLVMLTMLTSTVAFGQGDKPGTKHDFPEKTIERVDKPGMGEKMADRADKPGENKPTTQVAVTTAVPNVVPPTPTADQLKVQLSPVSVKALQKIADMKKAIKQMEALLVGSFLIGALQNPKDAAGQTVIDITTGGWEAVATASKQLGVIQRSGIQRVITFTREELETRPPSENNPGEVDFWKKMDEAF